MPTPTPTPPTPTTTLDVIVINGSFNDATIAAAAVGPTRTFLRLPFSCCTSKVQKKATRSFTFCIKGELM
eukprot:8688260-Lingulodinium_polyedra.AAC.1